MTFFQRNKKPIIIILIAFPLLLICACVGIVNWALKQPSARTSTPSPTVQITETSQRITTSTPEPTKTTRPSSTKTQIETYTMEPTLTSTVPPTKTQYPTSTKPTGPTSTPAPELVKILGNIWSGVNVYYGNPPKTVFSILGGNDSCNNLPSGRGLFVEYPDGSQEWKDREYIVTSGLFFVNKNDPAIKTIDWFIYPCD